MLFYSSHPAFVSPGGASATYNSVNTRACAAEIQYKWRMMRMECRSEGRGFTHTDARAEPIGRNKVGPFTRPWSFQSSPLANSTIIRLADY